MRKILFLYLFFLCLSNYAQTKLTLSREAYFMLEDSVNFYYRGCTFCGNCPFGEGTYEKQGRKIKFEFDKIENTEMVAINTIDTNLQNGFFFVNLTVFEDSLQTPLITANISYGTKGTYTDLNGKARLKININDSIDKIKISYIGFDPISIPIQPYNQSISVKLNYTGFNTIYDTTWVYKSKFLRKKKLKFIKK